VVAGGFTTTTFEIAVSPGGTAINETVAAITTATITSGPTLPTSYTNYRRIGAIRTDASSNILAFTQWYDDFVWAVPINDLSTSAQTTAAILTQLSVPCGVICKARFRLDLSNAAAGVKLLVTSPAETSAAVGAVTGNTSLITQVAAQSIGQHMEIQTDIAREIRTIGNTATTTITITTFGWADSRGQ
jgi:hypothetical protein